MLIAVTLATTTVLSACKKKEDPDATMPSASVSAVATAEPAPTVSASAEPPKVPTPVVVNTAAGEAAVKACCAALRAEAKTAAVTDKSAYEGAAGLCDNLAKSVKSGSANAGEAKRTIRAQIQRTKSIPGACQ
jgi:hypothetical protein